MFIKIWNLKKIFRYNLYYDHFIIPCNKQVPILTSWSDATARKRSTTQRTRKISILTLNESSTTKNPIMWLNSEGLRSLWYFFEYTAVHNPKWVPMTQESQLTERLSWVLGCRAHRRRFAFWSATHSRSAIAGRFGHS